METEFSHYSQALTHLLFLGLLGSYLILNLQWYSYRLERVVFHHAKWQWHLSFFVVPVIAYYITGKYFWIFLLFAYLPVAAQWYRRMDKKLVLTARVKRFYLFLLLFALGEQIFCFGRCAYFSVLLPLIAAYAFSMLSETLFLRYYRANAKARLASMKNLRIVAITASFGKTSIKNFLYHLVKNDFAAYMTPGSVNTEVGLIADINTKLPDETQIYIAEAGARQRGDILAITRLLNQHYAVIGSVGPQHLEYFKTVDAVRATKREILVSPAMRKGFVHESADIKAQLLETFGEHGDTRIENVVSGLEGTRWEIVRKQDGKEKRIPLSTSLIGGFNALNITAAYLCARELGVAESELVRRVRTLPPVAHRMQRIDAGGKIIIDDSFNGNIEGMLEAIRIAEGYAGRKVIVTPGIVEADEELNIRLAKRINTVFDLAIITSDINHDLLSAHIDTGRRKRVFNKAGMELMLAHETRPGDLILFANDAPNFM
jgi:UDP-N-acetylmuramoyl-tripeptide--D-alanyl-D-alanine ligase